MANISKNVLKRYDEIQTTNETFELKFPYAYDPNPLVDTRLVLSISNNGLSSTMLTKAANFTVDYSGIKVSKPNLENWDTSTSPTAPGDMGFSGDNGTPAKPTYTFNNDSTTGIHLAGVGNLAFDASGSTRFHLTQNGLFPTANASIDIGASNAQLRAIYSVSANLGAGSAASPSLTFGTANTGFYSDGTNIGVSVNGSNILSFGSSGTSYTQPVYFSQGTTTAPSIAFIGDTNTGIYQPNIDEVAITNNGTTNLTIKNTSINTNVPLETINGTAALPSYSFTSDATTGMYLIGATTLGVTANGTNILSISDQSVISTKPLLNTNGTAAVPSYSFSNNPSTGLSSNAPNTLSVSTNGVERILVGNSSTSIENNLLVIDGTISSPSVGFISEPTTGMYHSGNHLIDFTINGVDKLQIADTNINSTVNLNAPNGTSALPSYTFTNDTTTGMFLNAAGDLGLSVSGVEVLQATPTTITTNAKIQNVSGTTAVPSYSFNTDSDSGLSNPAPNTISVSTNGVERIKVTNASTSIENNLLVVDGTVSNPSVGFISEPTTGIYHSGNHLIDFTINGVEKVQLSDTSINSYIDVKVPDGTSAAPSYTFNSDATTGMFLNAIGNVGLVAGGSNIVSVTSTDTTINNQIKGINGTVSTPTYSFNNDSTSGMYLKSSHDVRLTVNSTDTLIVNTNVETTVPVIAPEQSAAAPSYAFKGFSSTGMYHGTSSINFAINGTDAFVINNSSVTLPGTILIADGSAAAPSLAFTTDTNTGIYHPTADSLAISTGGAARVIIDNSSMTITGNLTIQGTTTTVNAANLVVTDNTILLNKDEAGAGVSLGYAGVLVSRGTLPTEGWLYDEGNKWWGPAGPTGTFSANVGSTQIVGNISEINTRNAGSSLKVNGTSILLKGSSSNGTNLLPSYSWVNDSTTGMYLNAVGDLRLSVSGADKLLLQSTKLTSTVAFNNISGTAAAPAYTFTSNPNTGLYNPSSNVIGLSTNGTQRVTIDTSNLSSTLNILGPDGSVTNPTYSFSSETNTGIYHSGSHSLDITINGTRQLQVTDTSITTNEVIKNVNGLVTSPSYTFTSDSTSGMFLNASGDVRLTSSGTNIFGLTTTSITSTVPFDNISGNATTPAYSFSSDNDTGIYNPAANKIAIATNGIERVTVDTNNVTSTLDVLLPDGSATTPAIGFSSETNTGIYHSGSHSLDITINGTRQLQVTDTSITTNEVIKNISGTVIAPSYTFTSDSTSGIYLNTAGDLRVSVSGTNVISATPSVVSVNTQVQNVNGTAAAPAYSFTSDTNTGIYGPSSDTLGIATGGIQRVSIGTNTINTTNTVLGPDGSVTSPTYSFSGESNTGIYRSGSHSLDITINGTRQLQVTDTSITTGEVIKNVNGSASAPAYSFTSDPNTGISASGSDQLYLNVGGTSKVEINSTAVIVNEALNVTGGAVIGNPSGGNEGNGTINAEAMYIQGDAVATVDSAIAFSIVFGY
jgi:hypothetical protein